MTDDVREEELRVIEGLLEVTVITFTKDDDEPAPSYFVNGKFLNDGNILGDYLLSADGENRLHWTDETRPFQRRGRLLHVTRQTTRTGKRRRHDDDVS